MTLHETIRSDDFKRNTVLQHCCDIVLNGYNIVPTLQRCVALIIVGWESSSETSPLSAWAVSTERLLARHQCIHGIRWDPKFFQRYSLEIVLVSTVCDPFAVFISFGMVAIISGDARRVLRRTQIMMKHRVTNIGLILRLEEELGCFSFVRTDRQDHSHSHRNENFTFNQNRVSIAMIEWFSYDLEMKPREQNRNELIERTQTRVAFCWLSERSGEKTLCPRTF